MVLVCDFPGLRSFKNMYFKTVFTLVRVDLCSLVLVFFYAIVLNNIIIRSVILQVYVEPRVFVMLHDLEVTRLVFGFCFPPFRTVTFFTPPTGFPCRGEYVDEAKAVQGAEEHRRAVSKHDSVDFFPFS